MSESLHTTSPLVAALERTWSAIQRHHPEVPPVILRIGRGSDRRKSDVTLGHWWPSTWKLKGGDQRLADGAKGVLETLLHEAAHGLAHARDVADTSRNGIYHNKRYRALAEELGLIVGKHARRGWQNTDLTAEVEARYAAELGELEAAILGHRRLELPAAEGGKKRPPNGGRALYVCRCSPPRKAYLAPGVADLGELTCGLCGGQLHRDGAPPPSEPTQPLATDDAAFPAARLRMAYAVLVDAEGLLRDVDPRIGEAHAKVCQALVDALEQVSG